MYPLFPAENLAGALEFMCYFFTALGAVISLLVSLRF